MLLASDGGHAEVDGGPIVGMSVDLAEPAFPMRLGDAGEQVVADLLQARSLRWVWSQERTSDTRVFMNAGRSERAGAGPDGHLSFLEVGEEGVPLLVGEH